MSETREQAIRDVAEESRDGRNHSALFDCAVEQRQRVLELRAALRGILNIIRADDWERPERIAASAALEPKE